jgi:hypothetical protein
MIFDFPAGFGTLPANHPIDRGVNRKSAIENRQLRMGDAMSTHPMTERRHAFGMPAGSVRALLGFGVLGLLWFLALRSPRQLPEVFVSLMFVMILILAHYYTAHGRSTGSGVSRRHALGLPAGSVRFLLLVGFLGLAYFLYHNESQLGIPQGQTFYLMVGLVLAGFFLGYLTTGVMRSPDGSLPAWFQDMQAWVALLALIGLVVLVMIYTVINPSVSEERQLNVDKFEAVAAGLVSLYFGARSQAG